MNFFYYLKHFGLTLILFLFVTTGVGAQPSTDPKIDYQWNLPITVVDKGKSVVLSGKINVKKYSAEQLKSFKLSLFYAEVKLPKTGEKPTQKYVDKFYDSALSYNTAEDTPEKNPDSLAPIKPTIKIGISTPAPITNIAGVFDQIANETPSLDGLSINPETGEYYFRLTGLTPGARYYYAQKLETPGGIEVKTSEFDSSKGYITQKAADDDFEERSYRLLSGFPGLSVLLDPDLCLEYIRDGKIPADHKFCTTEDPSGFGGFINYAFRIMIGISAVLLVLRIMLSGYQYIVTDVPFLKTSAKAKLAESFFGLLLALSAYLLLNTINPKLVSNKIAIQGLTFTVDLEGDDQAGEAYKKYLSSGKPGSGITGYNFNNATFPTGVICPTKGQGSGDITTIAKSFIGKITYSQLDPPPKGPRGTNSSTGHFFLDCSSYVNTVLKCSGKNPPAYAFTGEIFSVSNGATPFTWSDVKIDSQKNVYIKGKILNPGNLIGWKGSDRINCTSKGCSGHVVVYIGGGLIMDSNSGSNKSPGAAVGQPFSIEKYKERYRWLQPV